MTRVGSPDGWLELETARYRTGTAPHLIVSVYACTTLDLTPAQVLTPIDYMLAFLARATYP